MTRFAPVLALLALASFPAAAQASHQHDLQLDKQEIFAEVPSGGAVTTKRASCSSGYRVIQGSIRVDTVPGGPLTNVRVRASTPDDGDTGTWYYDLVNVTRSGNQAAQIKLMISCIRPTTSGGSGSQHSLSFGEQFRFTQPTAAGREFESSATLDCNGFGPAENPGFIPAGAGWVFDPTASYRQLIGVEPVVAQASGGSPGYFLGQSQNFFLGGNTTQTAYTLSASVRCLRHLTTAAVGEGSSHQHFLNDSVQIVRPQVPRTSGDSGYWSQSVSCPSGYYAIAPTWSIPGSANSNGLRLVGIGYQGDQDVFRFVNPGNDRSFVAVGVICLGTKTSFTNQRSAGAGPGPQQLLMSDRVVRATIGAGKTLRQTVGCAGKTDIVTAGGLGGAGAMNVRVVRSGGGPKATRWPFVLRNTASRATNVNLYVKCLSPWAEGHTLILDGLPSAAPDGVKACQPGEIPIRLSTEGSLTANARFTCLEHLTTQRINHVHRLHVRTLNGTVRGGFVKTFSCPAHYQAIAGRVTGAKHARLAVSLPGGPSWTFGFAGRAPSKVQVTCLKDSTTSEVPEPVTNQVVPAPA
ncbi:MAG: Conserved repeat protein [Solirubrobacterales bacterium]|nr:Conserved repeat protein [Solirubrobacterales bacterium]